MNPTSDFGTSVPVVDVSGLAVPGIEALPRVAQGDVELSVLTAFLTCLDLSALPSDFDVLEVVAAWDRVIASASAAQLRAVTELAARPEVYGPDADPLVTARRAERAPAGTTSRTCLGDEVAARLADGPAAAGSRCHAALELPVRFPRMWAELRAGRASEPKARLLVQRCSALSDDRARAVDARVAPVAHRQPPARFRQTVNRAVLRVDPATAAQRRERAEADRCVRVTPRPDGMAELWALLPAVPATAMALALDDRARSAKAAGDERTLDQLRADALTDGITTTVEVQVVVPASVLLGLGDDSAELVGHGPVDPSLARALATDGTWRRLLTDPDDRSLLSVSPTTYRPGAVLARHVAARDRTCRFPTCHRPAGRCDLDHTVPFDHVHGLTVDANLGPLCRHHHQFKHAQPAAAHAPPRLRQVEPGRFVWTMPTGHQYGVDPPALIEPDDPLHAAPAPPTTSLVEHVLHRSLRGYHAGRRSA